MAWTTFLCLSLVLSWSLPVGNGEEVLTPLSLSETNGDSLNQKSREITKRVLSCVSMENRSQCEDFNYGAGIQCVGDEIYLTPCYCLSNSSLLGHCQFTCFRKSFLIAANMSSLIESQCSPFNRTGMFCGKCRSGKAHPAYSFSLKCIECDDSSWRNIVLYVAVAYGPLVLFLGILIMFRISVNTVPLLGFILVSQICSFTFQMRLAVGMIDAGHTSPYQTIGLYILSSAYGIWNLDFFRAAIPPFCIAPHWKMIHIMSLDYIVASFPFIFILLLYVTVEFYSRGYKLFCWWKPFHWCLSRLKNEMNIKVPLVDAFGTFFSLSYAKILSTSFDILSVTEVWDKDGKVQHHVPYYAATDHISSTPFWLGLGMCLIFNILPIPVLLWFSLRPAPYQADPTDVSGFFRPLLNSLLAPYKDGRNGTYNCRFFSAVYLVVRIVLVVALLVSPNIFFQLVAAIVFLIVGMLVAVIKPYKSDVYTTVDTVLMLSLSVAYMGVTSYFYTHFISPPSITIGQVFSTIACIVPILYFCVMMAHGAIYVRRFPQRAFQKLSRALSGIKACLLLLWAQTRRRRRSPRHERCASISSRGTMYVAIESGTVRVSNVDLCNN